MAVGVKSNRFRRLSANQATIIDGMPVLPAGGTGYIVENGATVQTVINSALAGDVIFLKEGAYNEAITVNKRLTLVGLGGRGAAFMQPTASNSTAITVTASDVTIINLGGEGTGTGGGLLVSAAADLRRFRAFDSKFEGGAFGVKLQATGGTGVSVGDSRFEDCEFCWTTTAFHLTATGGSDAVTQTLIKNCLFHNFTADGVLSSVAGPADLWIVDNVFANQEDGTEPTQYLDIDDANTTGLVTGNRFATTVHASAKIAIAAGVIYVGNYAQAEGPATGGGTSGRPD